MTDTEKLLLIKNIVGDCMEFVDSNKDSMDALTTCIITICEFKSEEES